MLEFLDYSRFSGFVAILVVNNKFGYFLLPIHSGSEFLMLGGVEPPLFFFPAPASTQPLDLLVVCGIAPLVLINDGNQPGTPSQTTKRHRVIYQGCTAGAVGTFIQAMHA